LAIIVNVPYTNDNNPDYAFKIYTHGTNFKTTTGYNQNNYIAQNNHNTKTDIKGTENKVLKNQVLLYPNPTTGRFTISFNTIDESDMEGQKGDCKIIIYDVIGSIVYENNNIVLPFDININKYPVGVYAVRIQTKEDIYNTKITKL